MRLCKQVLFLLLISLNLVGNDLKSLEDEFASQGLSNNLNTSGYTLAKAFLELGDLKVPLEVLRIIKEENIFSMLFENEISNNVEFLENIEKNIPQERILLAYTLKLRFAEKYFMLGKKEKAKKLFDEAYSSVQNIIAQDHDKLDWLFSLVPYLKKVNSETEINKIFNRIESFWKQEESYDEKDFLLYSLISNYSYYGKTDKALDLLEILLKQQIVISNEDDCDVITELCEIGDLLLSMDFPAKAKEVFQKAISICKKRFEQKQDCIFSISLGYPESKFYKKYFYQFDDLKGEVEKYLKLAIEELKKNKTPQEKNEYWNLLNKLNDIFNFYLENGDLDKARSIAVTVDEIDESNDFYNKYMFYFITNFYLKKWHLVGNMEELVMYSDKITWIPLKIAVFIRAAKQFAEEKADMKCILECLKKAEELAEIYKNSIKKSFERDYYEALLGHIAVIYLNNGFFDKAMDRSKQIMNEQIRLNLMFEIGQHFCDQYQLEKVEKLLNENRGDHELCALIHSKMGARLITMGKNEAAALAFRKAMKLRPEETERFVEDYLYAKKYNKFRKEDRWNEVMNQAFVPFFDDYGIQ